MSSADFLTDQGQPGVVLTEAARRKFLGEYEAWMLQPFRPGRQSNNATWPGFREVLRAEVRKYLKMLRAQPPGSQPFLPFTYNSGEEIVCDTSSVTT
jgi:hypothetical protein